MHSALVRFVLGLCAVPALLLLIICCDAPAEQCSASQIVPGWAGCNKPCQAWQVVTCGRCGPSAVAGGRQCRCSGGSAAGQRGSSSPICTPNAACKRGFSVCVPHLQRDTRDACVTQAMLICGQGLGGGRKFGDQRSQCTIVEEVCLTSRPGAAGGGSARIHVSSVLGTMACEGPTGVFTTPLSRGSFSVAERELSESSWRRPQPPWSCPRPSPFTGLAPVALTPAGRCGGPSACPSLCPRPAFRAGTPWVQALALFSSPCMSASGA